MLGSSLIDNFLLTMHGPHLGYHVPQRFTKETLESLQHKVCPIPSIIRFTLTRCWAPVTLMVLFVSRPKTRAQRTICTSVSPRASTRVSPDFTLLGLHAPSFKSQQSRSRSVEGAHVQAFTFIALAPHINMCMFMYMSVSFFAHLFESFDLPQWLNVPFLIKV